MRGGQKDTEAGLRRQQRDKQAFIITRSITRCFFVTRFTDRGKDKGA